MLVACEECGSSLSDSAPGCPRCGAPPAIFLGEQRQCAECRGDYRPAYESCTHCGATRSVALGGEAPAISASAGRSTKALHPWARCGAKFIDATILLALLSCVAKTSLDWRIGLGSNWDHGEDFAKLFVLWMMLYPFWDATFLTLTGGSPGRAIFRHRIVNKRGGGKPPIREALSRAWRCWFFGCGLGVPVIFIVTMLLSKHYLEKYGETRWDMAAQTEAIHEGPLWWSWALLMLTPVATIAILKMLFGES